MTVKLSFSDLFDLQSRLVLLPRIEEEGLGAIIASYTPLALEHDVVDSRFLEEKKHSDEEDDRPMHMDKKASVDCVSLKTEEDETMPTCSDESHLDHATDCATTEELIHDQASCDEKERKESTEKLRETEKLTEPERGDEIEPQDVVGKTLVAIEGVSAEKDWLAVEFSEILACTRSVKLPIVLHFDSAPLEEDNETSNHVTTFQAEKLTRLDESRATASSWSSWGISVASIAASNAKEYASATAVAVAKAADEARIARLAKPTIVNLPPSPPGRQRKCCLCLQLSNGSFVELAGPHQKLPKVTTTSILSVRESPTLPCPRQGYRYEWFRLLSTPTSDDYASESSSDSSSTSRSSESSVPANNHIWMPLQGTHFSVYQPCANDVGHRLRCVVHIKGDSEQPTGSNGDDRSSLNEVIVVCDTLLPIAADMNMFNGARQALLRGSYFGNLDGRGPAEGRVFGLNVAIGFTHDKSIASAVTINQISGGIAEPIHLGALTQVSAIADPSNPKNFDLVFPFGLPEESSMVSALSQDGCFLLTAPNRITREMLLLALGIANFSGDPADLTETTVLFPGFVGSPETGTPAKQTIHPNDDMFFTPEQGGSLVDIDHVEETHDRSISALELELQNMRSKMSRKDKVISDLQRQLSHANTVLMKTDRDVTNYRIDLQMALEGSKEHRNKLRRAEKNIDARDTLVNNLKSEHAQLVKSLEKRVDDQSDKIASLEKSVRSYQNEKAVLSAAVEARDSKLEKMNDLQAALDSLSIKVTKGDSLRSEMSEMGKRYEILCEELENVATSETECKEQLQRTLSTMNELCENLEAEKKRRKQCQGELESAQRMNQKLKAERNSFKKKAESLTKEMSRLCKGGLTLQSIEKILSDEESRKTEVEVLRAQKQKALEDLQQYRSAYEQQLVAQLNIGVNGAAIKALEQKAELERVVDDLTEYVNAKEMQLETMREVNQALTDELKQLAKKIMDKNDI